MKTFKHILVPTDFSRPSLEALDVGISLASAFDAELTLLHSWEIPVYPYMEYVGGTADLITAVEQAAGKRLAEELERVQKQLPRAKSNLRMGIAWQAVMDATSELHPDLIVMGTHGRQGLNHMLLGSVAEKVVRLSEVPVLTVHPSKPA